MKKVLKILAWLVGILVLLLIVAAVGVKLFFPVEKVRELAIERASLALGRPVSVADIDISFWGGLGVELVDVVVANPPGVEGENFLEAEGVDLKLRLLPLLSSEFRVDRLIIDNPRIVLTKNEQGLTNYDFQAVDSALPPEAAEPLPPEARTVAAAVSFENLEINGAQVVYQDDSAGVRMELVNLNLETTLKNPAPGLYLSTGKLRMDRVRFALDESYPSVSLGLSYRGVLDLNTQHLSLETAELQLNGLSFKVKGEVHDLLGEPRASGNLKSKQVTVADLLHLLPPEQLEAFDDITLQGGFSLDVDLAYDPSTEGDALEYSGTAMISDMEMTKKDIDGVLRFSRALIDFKNDNVRMTIQEGMFDGQPLKGHLVVEDFENPTVNGEIAGSVNLAFLQPFLPAEDAHELGGTAKIDVKFSGRVEQPGEMDFSGNVVVTSGRYNSQLVPQPMESITLNAYFDNNLVNVREFSTKFASGHLAFSGRLDNVVPYLMADSVRAREIFPSVDGTLEGKVDFSVLEPYLPEKGSPHLSGQLAVDLKFSGRMAPGIEFNPRGRMSIINAAYEDSLLPEPITSFNAEMTLAPDTITISNMVVQFVSSDVSFSGKLANPFPYLLPVKSLDRKQIKRPLFFFELSSHRFDIDKLFPEAVPGSGENRAAVSADSVSIVILPDIDGRGTFSIDTLIYSRVDFTKLNGKVKIRDRKIECYDVTGSVYSGKVSGKTTVDLSDFEDPQYDGDFKATQIEADDFISRFTSFGGHVFGKCDLTGSYSAQGWDPDDFLNSLTMDGKGSLKSGKVVTSGAVYSLVKGLADKTGQSFSKEQPLKNLNTNIVVKNGEVRLNNLKTALGSLGDLEIGGFYSFEGNLDYTGTLMLTKGTTQKLTSKGGVLGGLAALLADKSSERLVLPLKITGTTTKPKAEFDYSAIAKSAGDNLGEKAGDLLKGLFDKKKKK